MYIVIKFKEIDENKIYFNGKGCEFLAVGPVLFRPIPIGQTAPCENDNDLT